MRLPSYNPVTLLYGATTEPYSKASPHIGVDFSYLPDDNVYAPEGGRVELQADYPGSKDGNTVHLYWGTRHHAFCHLQSFAVQVGQVAEGQILGKMGNTGFAQGKHLHWALKVNGQFTDPLTLLTGGKGADMLQEGQINDNDDIAELWRLAFFRDPTPKEITDNQGLIGKYWNDASKALRTTEAFIGVRQQYYDGAKTDAVKLKPGKYIVE